MALLETLTDDFTTLNTTKWPTRTAGVTVTGGVLQISVPSGSALYYSAQSAQTYTAANSYLLAKVTTATPGGASLSSQTYMSVDVDDNNWIAILRDGSNLVRTVRTAGVDSNTTIGAYNASTMAWWRIRHNGTGFVCGYSTDGSTWTEIAAVTPSWTLTTTMRATLMVGKWAADAVVATGTYDNVNLPPATANTSAAPTSLTVPLALGDPSVTYAGAATPGSLPAPVTLGDPSVSFTAAYAGTATPDSLAVPAALGAPAVSFAAVGPVAAPDSLDLGITLGAPALGFMAAGTYGHGNYGEGPYGKAPLLLPSVVDPVPHMPDLMPDTAGWYDATDPPSHYLAIGPWKTGVAWRGAPNYGVKYTSSMRSAGVLPMPPATSKTFTLRVGAGGEARVDFTQPRHQTILVEKMTTDLWWRRKAASSNVVEIIGRFNADKVDITTAEDGQLRISTTYVDYQQLIGERLVLDYVTPATPPAVGGTSIWAKGSQVRSVITFILPTDMNMDLTALTSTDLGITKEALELPLATTVADAMNSLQAVSVAPWEWWVDLPATSNAKPKLYVTAGQRGRDLNTTLVDTGTGHGPIAQWTLQDSGENYANALYLQGNGAGVIEVIPEQYDRYMRRDASESDSTIKATPTAAAALHLAAARRLAALSDQRPSLTIVLTPGFWRGRAHIDVGDRLGVLIELGADTVVGTYRVTEIAVEIDDGNRETVTLTCGHPTPSKDPRSRYSVVSRLVRVIKNNERMA